MDLIKPAALQMTVSDVGRLLRQIARARAEVGALQARLHAWGFRAEPELHAAYIKLTEMHHACSLGMKDAPSDQARPNTS